MGRFSKFFKKDALCNFVNALDLASCMKINLSESHMAQGLLAGKRFLIRAVLRVNCRLHSVLQKLYTVKVQNWHLPILMKK